MITAALDDLLALARRIVDQTNGNDVVGCHCPDEPHQNALHDLAHDLVRLMSDADDGQANTCPHGSATGIDTTPIGPAKVWRCDHCGLRWSDQGYDTAEKETAHG